MNDLSVYDYLDNLDALDVASSRIESLIMRIVNTIDSVSMHVASRHHHDQIVAGEWHILYDQPGVISVMYGSTLLFGGDIGFWKPKMGEVMEIYRNLQPLFDAVCERFPSLRSNALAVKEAMD